MYLKLMNRAKKVQNSKYSFNNTDFVNRMIDIQKNKKKEQKHLQNKLIQQIEYHTNAENNQNPSKTSKQESNQNPDGNEEANNQEQVKTSRPRHKLDENMLLFSDFSIKRLYEQLNKQDFKSKPVANLNKFIKIVKNWHFELFPKYDFNYFISKVSDLGKKPPTRVRPLTIGLYVPVTENLQG